MNILIPFVASVDNFRSKHKIIALNQTKVCELGVARVTTGNCLTCRNDTEHVDVNQKRFIKGDDARKIPSTKSLLMSFTGVFECIPTTSIRKWLTLTGFALWCPIPTSTDQFEKAAVADVAVDSHLSVIAVCALQITYVEIWVIESTAQKVLKFAVCGPNVT